MPYHSLVSPELSIVQILPEADKVILLARPKSAVSSCPCCGCQTDRVHSHYVRRLADLPWQDRIVEIRLRARRFRCANSECPRQIFTERLPQIARSKARRTSRLCDRQLAIGFAIGGKPGARLSRKLGMPASGDTLLRMIRAVEFKPPEPLRVIGIDDWAWRKGQRYGTIICDLERNRVIDLLPDRNANTVAHWLKRHPGIEVIARDRAGVYSKGARRGAPDAMQVADRFHLLQSLSDALHLAVSRHRNALGAAAKAVAAEVVREDNAKPESRPKEASTKLDQLRRKRRSERRSHYAEILDLRANGLAPRRIALRIGMSVRTVERWLAAGGEPEHRRPRAHSVIVGFQDYLEKRWDEGERRGSQLWAEIKLMGFEGSKATIYRWTAVRKQGLSNAPSNVQWRLPSRRNCARLLMGEPTLLDEQTELFLHHLLEVAPELSDAARLARRFAGVIRGQDDASLQQWIEDASNSELAALARGIARDIAAVRGAIKQPWSTSPVEGHINRLKTMKRQMYGRSGFALLRNRVLATD